MNKISVIGLDLAKNVFQIHAVDEQGGNFAKNGCIWLRLSDLRNTTSPCSSTA